MKVHKFSITKAKYIHAEDICHVLIKSIKELCLADHQNDPAKLENWLRNKTPENIKTWIENSSVNFLVALSEQEKIIGVSMISNEGKILLNYLLPDYIGRGVEKLMLNEPDLEKIGIFTSLVGGSLAEAMNDINVSKNKK